VALKFCPESWGQDANISVVESSVLLNGVESAHKVQSDLIPFPSFAARPYKGSLFPNFFILSPTERFALIPFIIAPTIHLLLDFILTGIVLLVLFLLHKHLHGPLECQPPRLIHVLSISRLPLSTRPSGRQATKG